MSKNEDAQDLRDLEAAIEKNAGKPLTDFAELCPDCLQPLTECDCAHAGFDEVEDSSPPE